jgi:hypothetical protein
MSGPWEVLTDQQIEAVCAYINDDQTVANYFGISRRRAESVRANMHQSIPRWLFRSLETNGNAGTNSHLAAADEAEAGSRRLNEAIQRLFRKWERIHGFQEGAAQILLPAGWSEEREAA